MYWWWSMQLRKLYSYIYIRCFFVSHVLQFILKIRFHNNSVLLFFHNATGKRNCYPPKTKFLYSLCKPNESSFLMRYIATTIWIKLLLTDTSFPDIQLKIYMLYTCKIYIILQICLSDSTSDFDSTIYYAHMYQVRICRGFGWCFFCRGLFRGFTILGLLSNISCRIPY